MRSAGLDVGDKTIGVALSDESGFLATGLEVIRRRANQPALDFARLQELQAQYGIAAWVVGLPRNMNGTYGPRADLCRAFAAELEQRSGIPVHLVDERLTTVQAQRALLEADVSRAGRKQVVDKVAATFILQSFLDRAKRNV